MQGFIPQLGKRGPESGEDGPRTRGVRVGLRSWAKCSRHRGAREGSREGVTSLRQAGRRPTRGWLKSATLGAGRCGRTQREGRKKIRKKHIYSEDIQVWVLVPG